MKKLFYIFALVAFTLASCEKNELDNNLQNSSTVAVVDNINRPIQPIILGNQLNNPFSVENMQIALDSLIANKESLNGSMRAPSTFNEFEISATDLYIRYLPKDSVEYRTLMNDTTLTLFDFPLDYELKQVGEYYKDPTVTGDYTWLYTRVPVGYTPHEGIEYEVLEELFILEHSPYYSVETEIDEDGMQKAKSVAKQNNNEALRVLQTVSLYLTGNLKQDSKDKNTYTNIASGMRKAKEYQTIKIFGKTIRLATLYYPSGTLKVKAFHSIDEKGSASHFSTATEVPLKGVKMHFLSLFQWDHAYTDEDGFYKSSSSFILDPIHTIYFSGNNKGNSWNLDRAWLSGGSCLWVQKYCFGVKSKDVYDATIDVTSDAWNACITNNAFYDYMTICDKHGISRPPINLKVALLEMEGSSSAPLLQNHLNTYGAGLFTGLVAISIACPGAAVVTMPAALLEGAIATATPDIILAGGNIQKYKKNKYWLLSDDKAVKEYTTTIWHELSHGSNFQRVNNEKGYINASLYWSSVIGTEVWNSITTTDPLLESAHGSKGDSNWEQIALCEGWAYYRSYIRMANNILYYWSPSNHTPTQNYPGNYAFMFDNLRLYGCSDANMEKSLTVKTFSEFKQNLKSIYANNQTICEKIEQCITNYYNR
jgi:hypothetical protein